MSFPFPQQHSTSRLTERQSDLAILDRHPEIESLYVTEFRALVFSGFGSTEKYLNNRLEWESPSAQDGSHFKAEGSEESIRVLENDWPYAVPPDLEHWVVWSQYPILHPDTAIYPTPAPTPPLSHHSPTILAKTEPKRTTWSEIAAKGLSGFIGGTGEYRGFGGDSEAGREIAAFTAARWKVEDGWETAW